jgi:hypothetical protein
MSRMNKKAMSFGPLLILISALIALGVLGLILSGILDFSKESLDQSACSLSAKANCYGKYLTMGVDTFSLKCPTQLKTITINELKAEADSAKKRMKELAKKFPKEAGKNEYVTENPTDDLAYEFVMNKIIAKDMKDCWDSFKDVPCLFSRWWLPWKGCNQDTTLDKCDGLKAQIQSRIPPAYCVVCTRYKFDEEIQKRLGGTTILLGKWMAVNEVPPGTGVSYAEYLENKQFPLLSEAYSYRPEQPYAVVFGTVKSLFLTYYTGVVFNLFGLKIEGTDDQKSLTLIPYDDVSNHCVYIEG